MILTAENRKNLGEEPVPVPLCPPQIPHGPTRGRLGESLATYRLSHDTATSGRSRIAINCSSRDHGLGNSALRNTYDSRVQNALATWTAERV
jgi:hypothetical protein